MCIGEDKDSCMTYSVVATSGVVCISLEAVAGLQVIIADAVTGGGVVVKTAGSGKTSRFVVVTS